MAAQPRPGIERLEAEGLGLRRLDHFPHVDPHAVEQHFQFVDQGNVDGAIGILQNLARFGNLIAGHRNHFRHPLPIELHGQFPAHRFRSADHLGNVAGGKIRIARVFPLGTIGQEEFPARASPLASRIGSTTSRVVPG